MATMASLIVEVGGNISQFVGEMTKLEARVGATAKTISKQFQVMATEVAGAVSAGMFVKMVDSTIDVLDHLHDLNKATGVSVENLAGLRVAAKQSGSDLDAMAQSINKLSQNIGKNSEQYKALGISTKDPMEAFKQFADIFKGLNDQQLKAALASTALGKSWQGAAPALAEGGKKLGELISQGSAHTGVMASAAEAADELNDKMVLLVGSNALMLKIVTPMLPVLNSVADTMLKLAATSDSTSNILKTSLVEALRAIVVLAGNVAFTLRGVGREIAGWVLQMQMIGEAMSLFKIGEFSLAADAMRRVAEVGKGMREEAAADRVAFDAWEASMMLVGTAADEANHQFDDVTRGMENMGAAAEKNAERLRKLVEAFLKVGKEAPKIPGLDLGVRMAEDIQKKQEEFDRLQGKQSPFNSNQIKLSLELQKNALRDVTPAMKAYLQSLAQWADQLDELIAKWKVEQEYMKHRRREISPISHSKKN
jgi:hypothetical protein